jgi:hypothetical protein
VGARSNRIIANAVGSILRGRSYAATASVFAVALSLSNGAGAQNAATEAAPTDALKEIIITGRRIALRNADDRKKNSESMIDSVVADEAGLLPDNSVTEVLQRVAGVTMVRFQAINDPDHFSVEGSGIQVRGLSGVAARLNGREVFSASVGQGLSFGDVTPELLAAVDVYKSATADLIEGGSGGQGLIHAALPNAHIIHMRRNPIDTCLSIYFQNFSIAYAYANDFEDLAHYYSEYLRLMAHWHAVLPEGTILDVSYEELVSHPEASIRRILEFVGLPWDARCLDFHATNRTVIASKWQVRQKISNTSVGRWRNYEPFVGSLRRLLTQ